MKGRALQICPLARTLVEMGEAEVGMEANVNYSKRLCTVQTDSLPYFSPHLSLLWAIEVGSKCLNDWSLREAGKEFLLL